VIDVPTDLPWRTEMHAAGGRPNERVVIVDGKEVHRCSGGPQKLARRTVGLLGPIRRISPTPRASSLVRG
jgi:hypothetical protein